MLRKLSRGLARAVDAGSPSLQCRYLHMLSALAHKLGPRPPQISNLNTYLLAHTTSSPISTPQMPCPTAHYPFAPRPETRVCTIPNSNNSVVKLHNGKPAFYRPKSWPVLCSTGRAQELGGENGAKKHLDHLVRYGCEYEVKWWAGVMLQAIEKDCWTIYSESESWDFTLVLEEPGIGRDPGGKVKGDLELARGKIEQMYPEFRRAKSG
jgi:hypothetical protein